MYIRLLLIISCFQCSKDTKMGANHNSIAKGLRLDDVVSNVPKILKWEQITTADLKLLGNILLFPMFQRY